MKKDWSSMFPVFEDPGSQQRYHQPLDFKIVKQLKEADMSYGPQATFTLLIVESIGAMNLTPDDWGNVSRATLSGGQYLVWKPAWQEYSSDTA